MNCKRFLALFIGVAMISTLVGCGSGGSGKTSTPPPENPNVVNSTALTPTATTSVAGTATTAVPITLSTGTATLVIPVGTGLYSTNAVPPAAIAGTPKITANVTSYIGAVPTETSTTGLFAANAAASVSINITTADGVAVRSFSGPLTVTMLTALRAGTLLNYFSFNPIAAPAVGSPGNWELEGTAVVAADRTVTFGITHLSGWAVAVAPSTVSLTGYIGDTAVTPIPYVTLTTEGLTTNVVTTTRVDGSYTLGPVPANTPFTLSMSKSGYADLRSNRMSFTTDSALNANLSSAYAMATSAELLGYGNTLGKGVIRSRVVSGDGTNLSGVVVTATDTQTGALYPVTYSDPPALPGASTLATGRYTVINVPDGATVVITASKVGYTFNSKTFVVKANSLSQGRIIGSP